MVLKDRSKNRFFHRDNLRVEIIGIPESRIRVSYQGRKTAIYRAGISDVLSSFPFQNNYGLYHRFPSCPNR